MPTPGNPLGRVVWAGTLGPDFGSTNAATAVNELNITFRVNVPSGITAIYNTATIDADRNGNRVFAAAAGGVPSELTVANAQAISQGMKARVGVRRKQQNRPPRSRKQELHWSRTDRRAQLWHGTRVLQGKLRGPRPPLPHANE